MRSQLNFPKSTNLLPKICIICGKKRWIKNKYDGKRKIEKLSKCETVTAGKLVKAANIKKDERLLHIRDKNLVSLEAQYHQSCHKSYTNVLYRNVQKKETDEKYQVTYEHFCKTIIEERIIDKREILRLSELTKMFKNIALEKEKLDISSYKSFSLKKRLQASHPYLIFLSQRRANESELVYVENLSASEVLLEKSSGIKKKQELVAVVAVVQIQKQMQFFHLQVLAYQMIFVIDKKNYTMQLTILIIA